MSMVSRYWQYLQADQAAWEWVSGVRSGVSNTLRLGVVCEEGKLRRDERASGVLL
jgi:hypothetical protein